MAKRGKRKKKRRSNTKKSGGKRKPGMGILGKMGIAIGVGSPFTISGIAAFSEIQEVRGKTNKEGTLFGYILYGIYAFFNSLVEGFGGERPFKTMSLAMKDGSRRNTGFNASVPKGSYIPIVTIGATMTLVDLLMVKFMGKNVKMPGTNYNLI